MLKKINLSGRERSFDKPDVPGRHYYALSIAAWAPSMGLKKPDIALQLILDILSKGGTIEGVIKPRKKFPEFIAHIPRSVILPRHVTAKLYMYGCPEPGEYATESLSIFRMSIIPGLVKLLKTGHVRVIATGTYVHRGLTRRYFTVSCMQQHMHEWFGSYNFRVLEEKQNAFIS